MTTAHRPTFDPARGKEALRGPGFHQRLLPAYTSLKYRQPGQGGSGGISAPTDTGDVVHDMRAELLAAEAAHFAKKHGSTLASPHDEDGDNDAVRASLKRSSAATNTDGDEDTGGILADADAKRRRVLQESRAIDADSSDDDGGPGDESEADDDDDDDDSSSDESDDSEAELQRELERVRREKAEKKAREERERAAEEEEERVRDIAMGNPLLNKPDFNIKRRWNDDVVFKNQARGTEDKGKKEFVNDMLRSDFHRRFMNKYVR
ncbi:Pre-mRNA-splicing factor cwc15 [Ceratocystis fimbriata CBS 114723]|uniref:Pre-mRNA-splicing factor cwc15 n=1 Tax=Ceratocystis fimbriata CBS 114723 TaxID=1035309 RepID=A0A2C5WZF0_9PEZI|nr:Pre-mRNA-splicing factor cwc15 [Ceratocystis fimbriata CBS 114723]